MKEGKHSFIHDIRIAKPCPADWDKMTGDERKRFCHQCKLNVYNISEMTIAEAEELIITSEGRVCLRLYRRSDGTVLTKDCPVGLAAVRRKLATTYGAVAALIAVWFGLKGPAVTGERCGVTGEVAAVSGGTASMQGQVMPSKGLEVMGDYAGPTVMGKMRVGR